MTLTPLTLKTLPTNLHPWQVREIEESRARMVDPAAAEERDGVKYWKSNGSVIPSHVFKDAYVECPWAQKEAYEKQLNRTMRAIRKASKPRKPSAEEMFEMRAAYGTGKTVVNILTGQKYRT